MENIKDIEIWENLTSYQQSHTFMQKLYTDINDKKFKKLTYRKGQHKFALEILYAIRDNSILLLEAGVGIVKTYGYLIPTFTNLKKRKTFNKIIISTSSIALQQQLLTDINEVAKLLNLKVNIENQFENEYGVLNVNIAKGLSNYICLNRLKYKISQTEDKLELQTLLNILNELEIKQTADKSELSTISSKVWETINLKNRGYCSNCNYINKINCPYYKTEQQLNQSDIIITNHANLAYNVGTNNPLYKNANAIIFDETHKLPELMKSIDEKELRLNKILNLLQESLQGLGIIIEKEEINVKRKNEILATITSTEKKKYLQLLTDIIEFFIELTNNTKENFNKLNNQNRSILETNKLPLTLTKTTIHKLTKIIEGLKELQSKTNHNDELEELINTLTDIKKIEESQNECIYWIDFYKEKGINIGYTKRNNESIIKNIFQQPIPIICTSATMIPKKDLGLDLIDNRTIKQSPPIPSPYNYQENSICYYEDTTVKKENYDEYILYLAEKIIELIRLTNGKTLILFTNKMIMNQVYQLITTEEYPFEILLQNDHNSNEVKQQFKDNTNSCLFATGSFWEGIDIKGKSLSQVIITNLPFDLVNAITQDKINKYTRTEDKMNNVIIPNMLIKLKQGTGRAIRSEQDTAIISFLDPRTKYYLPSIKSSLPYQNYTTNLREVYEFTCDKILKEELHTVKMSKTKI